MQKRKPPATTRALAARAWEGDGSLRGQGEGPELPLIQTD